MEVIVAYDVNTQTKEGRRRLRRVATICCGFGQRVQNSVFECQLTEAQLDEMEHRLLQEMSLSQDRLRIYRLPGPRERLVRIHGIEPEFDFREPLII